MLGINRREVFSRMVKIIKRVKKLSRTQVGVSLTKEDRDILNVKEDDLVEVSKNE